MTNDDRQLQILIGSFSAKPAPGIWRFTFRGTKVETPNTTLSFVTGETGGPFRIMSINGQPPSAGTTKIITDAARADSGESSGRSAA